MVSRLWIGGATDAGKTTVARRLALAHTLALFECDRRDAAEHERIARAAPSYRAFLEMDVEARWVGTTPEWLLRRPGSRRSWRAERVGGAAGGELRGLTGR